MKHLFVYCLLFLSFSVFSQEVLLEPSFIKPPTKSNKRTTAINIVRLSDTLTLPFIDDFSSNTLAVENEGNLDSSYKTVHQLKYYSVASGSFFDSLNASLDTSFTTVMTSSDTTISANIHVDTILLYKNDTSPAVFIDSVLVWNNYQLVDSNNSGLFDTLFVAGLKNDSTSFGIIGPGNNLWVDNLAWINSSYPLNTPSIGAATLDAVDHYGYLYPQGTSAAFPADSLTSKNINLQGLLTTDTLYLSFMAQPGGIGDEPENQDKLVVQFKDSSGAWIQVWSSSEESNWNTSEFSSFYLPLNKIAYLHSAFQFRFINYASLSAVSTAWQSNADQWHIDYVVLDSARSDKENYIQDVCFSERPSTKINGYYSVPWQHYQSNTSITHTSANVKINNIGSQTPTVNITSSVDENGTNIFSAPLVSSSLVADENKGVTGDFSGLKFASSEVATASFNVQHLLTTGSKNLIANNDTVRFNQFFDQSYAYDDGSAEAGYGLNSFEGEFAMKYELLTDGDTLTAIDIYFNNTLYQENFNIPIILKVWRDAQGVPGDTLYTGFARYPMQSDSLNTFLSYKLNRPINVGGTIYIGWQQLSSELVNIGLDRNNTTTNKAFYNVGSDWNSSSIEGAVMIRPRFRSYSFLNIEQLNSSVKVFPNPVKTLFKIKGFDQGSAILYNNQGALIKNITNLQENQIISLEGIPSGVYQLVILSNQKQEVVQIIKL